MVAVLPLFGAALGALLAALFAALVPPRHQSRGGPSAIVVLGFLIGVVSALAWYVDPGHSGEIGWVGGFEETIDYGYPASRLALWLLAALAAHLTGVATPPSQGT